MENKKLGKDCRIVPKISQKSLGALLLYSRARGPMTWLPEDSESYPISPPGPSLSSYLSIVPKK